MAAFTDEESMLLINIFGQPEIQAKFKNNKKGHRTIWREIATQLSSLSDHKFNRTDQQCKDRLGNLKKKYFALKRELRSGDSTPTWHFWDELNVIFGARPTANPQVVYDSFGDESTGSASPAPPSMVQCVLGSGRPTSSTSFET
jgi:Myb/SANT-like DNA-binding domain